jgi:eukaryotic-like serine/threonine-protein kinase
VVPVANECPTDDLLVAFATRALTPAETEGIASHLDGCESCRIAVRAGAIGSPPPMLTQPVATRTTIAIGSRIGRYDVRRLLGVGGMGQVFVAHDRELHREVALKVLRPELADVAERLADRLVRESRLTAKIAHPAVMTVYDVGRDGDTVFIAMELIRGETLGVHVARARPRLPAVLDLFERAGAGLAAAHAAGVVHRDFKPDNVLVETSGERRVIVTDFGIARASELDDLLAKGSGTHDVKLTTTGLAVGTPAYMAPEQLDGKAVDQRADVFAFAVSLWEMLFGTRPFPGTSIEQIRKAMAKRPVPPRAVPNRLLRALHRGLEMEPDARFPDLPRFVQELRAIRTRRRRVQIAVGAIALVGVGVSSGYAFTPSSHEYPCAPALDQFVYNHDALERALGPASAKVLPRLDALAARWRVQHVATCVASRSPAQDPDTASCLNARRIEITGLSDDIIADGSRHADLMVALISKPEQCVHPPPAAVFSRIPENPELRRKVTALRHRMFDAQLRTNQGDYKATIATEKVIVKDAHDVWPPVEAEAQYLLGATQLLGADTKSASENLHAAAALAEAAHHDYVAVSAWTQLITNATFQDGDPKRGIEYAKYAESALSRLGYPVEPAAIFYYSYGTSLVQVGKMAEAEQALRHSAELSEQNHLPYLPQAVQGLGFLYEQSGRFADAIVQYRRAVELLGPTPSTNLVTFYLRLATNLLQLGKSKEALELGQKAYDMTQTIETSDEDRIEVQSTYAQMLEGDGQHDKALVEIHAAEAQMKKLEGERSQHYADSLAVEGSILANLRRYAEAEKVIARSCDVVAFRAGDSSTQEAECRISEVIPLGATGRLKEASALADRVIATLEQAEGMNHSEVVLTLGERGEVKDAMGDHAGALADLNSALERFDKAPDDPQRRIALRIAIAQAMLATDPVAAKKALTELRSDATNETIETIDGVLSAPRNHHWIL